MVYEMLVRIFRSPELIVRLTEHKPDYHCVKRCCEEEVIWGVCWKRDWCDHVKWTMECRNSTDKTNNNTENRSSLTIDEDHFGSYAHTSNTVGRSR